MQGRACDSRTPTRLAFFAATRADVDRIAAVAQAAGARAYEPPAACAEYTETYYAAFFEDPDGNKLEVVNR
jgi:predicted lactoylglutathione lyase